MPPKFPGVFSPGAGCGFFWGGGGVFICLERERDKENYIYGGKQKEQTKHGAVAALVTLSSRVFANSMAKTSVLHCTVMSLNVPVIPCV